MRAITSNRTTRGPGQWHHRFPLTKETISGFCRRHHIRRLSLFGFVLREDLNPQSDVDVLAEFESEHVPGLLGISRMEREVSELFGGRNVDLRTPEDLSGYLRNTVLQEGAVHMRRDDANNFRDDTMTMST